MRAFALRTPGPPGIVWTARLEREESSASMEREGWIRAQRRLQEELQKVGAKMRVFKSERFQFEALQMAEKRSISIWKNIAELLAFNESVSVEIAF